jgi:hypothetical protein
VDRCGDVALTLRCGAIVRGHLASENVEDHLGITDDGGATMLVPVRALLVMTGGAPALRREGEVTATITSRLREVWSESRTIRVLLADGAWRQGEVDFVGADHVTLRAVDTLVTVPMNAVEVWQLG